MVGETMKYWRDHVDEAQILLGVVQEDGEVPAKKLDCLYEALVAITRAINELEGKEAYGRHSI
jgi:hypothetical protein